MVSWAGQQHVGRVSCCCSEGMARGAESGILPPALPTHAAVLLAPASAAGEYYNPREDALQHRLQELAKNH